MRTRPRERAEIAADRPRNLRYHQSKSSGNRPGAGMGRASRRARVVAALALAGAMLATPAAAQNSNNCKTVAGLWTITNVSSFDMVIKPDGTGSFHTGISFKWRCVGNSLVYTDSWGITTRMTLSRDGMQMSGAGALGEPMSAVRKSALPASATAPAPKATAPAPRAQNSNSKQQSCATRLQKDLADLEDNDVDLEPGELEQFKRQFMALCLKEKG